MKYLIGLCMLIGFARAQQGGIRGVVTDGAETLPGVVVLVKGSTLTATTDIDGAFNIGKVPAGKQVLVFSFIGFADTEKEIEIKSGEVVDLGEIALKESGSLTLNDVEVKAQMKDGEAKAINMTKASSRTVNVISAEGVSKLPDRNAAEALQRLPGVVMERDQGEGRYISFRGTPNDWSSALVNGDRMPVADEESKTRAMKFDIFPASLIEYVVASKTLTPDIEGDAIGGSANFITRSAPADSILQINAGIGYNHQAYKPVYNVSAFYGNRLLNGKLGYLIGGSFFHRNWSTDNYQVFYGTNYNQAIQRMELRDYSGTRTTAGANAALEYKFSNYSKVYFKGTYGQMIDDEFNRKTMFNWGTGVGQSIRVQNIHNIMNTAFFGGEIGGSHKTPKGTVLDWRIASYDNRFRYGQVPVKQKNDPRNGYFVIEFEQSVRFTDMLYLDENGNQTDEFNAVEQWKFLDIDSPVDGYGDPDNAIKPTWRTYPYFPPNPVDSMLLFLRAYSETNQTRESDPIVAQLDVEHKFSNRLTVKGGFKARHKTGERKVGLEYWERDPLATPAIVYDSLSPEDLRLNGGFLEELDSPYDDNMFQFFNDDQIDNFIHDQEPNLTYHTFGVNTPYYAQFIGSSYRYSETVAAGYAMADVKITEHLMLIGGLRAEYTLPSVIADSVVEDIANSTRYLVESKSGKNYLALLPMLNLKWELGKKNVVRAAVTRSFRRPNFNEIKPGQPSIDYTNFDLIYGNPDLKPSYAINVDATYERYFGVAGMFSVSGYYKYVTDHIYTSFETASLDGTGISNEFQVPGGIISKKYQNAPKAYTAGVEIQFVRKFDFIKGFMKDFGVSANYTFTDSKMFIDARDEAQPLPRQSRNLFNASVFYENKRLIARVAVNYRDPYLLELNLYATQDPMNPGEVIVFHQDNEYDLFVGKSLTLDAAVSYEVIKNLSLYVEANNLTNTPFTMYRGRPERPVKTEYYSIRALFGIKYEIK
jgi:TonB-dependent receptor